jgi:hypothetical protein
MPGKYILRQKSNKKSKSKKYQTETFSSFNQSKHSSVVEVVEHAVIGCNMKEKGCFDRYFLNGFLT